jgi:hypothetical protein
MGWTLEKSTIDEREGSWYKNYDAASGPILKIRRFFIEASKLLTIIFRFVQSKFKNQRRKDIKY